VPESTSPPGAARTPRLRIEALGTRHAPALFAVLADPRIYAYVPDVIHETVDSLAARYARLEAGAPPGAGEVWLNWALRRVDTGAFIGTLQSTVVPGERAFIGYVLEPHSWGQGFAIEACAWLIGTLRQHYVLDEIVATVDVRNLRSIRLLERLGFRCAGTESAELRGETTTDFRYRLACGPQGKPAASDGLQV
jgi:ribosomal-protein-alanine N-acetyltransferase